MSSKPREWITATIAVHMILASVAAVAETRQQTRNPVESMTLSELTQLGHTLVNKTNATGGDLAVLAMAVSERYRHQRPIHSQEWPKWLDLLSVSGPHLSPPTGRMACSDIERSLLSSSAEMERLSCQTACQILDALLSVGEIPCQPARKLARILSETWICGSNEYKAASPKQIHIIADALRVDRKRQVKAHKMFASHVERTYMGNAANITIIPLKTWQIISAAVGTGLPEVERVAWGRKLRAAFAPNHETLLSMDTGNVWRLAHALYQLESPQKKAFEITAEHILHSNKWRSAMPHSVLWSFHQVAQLGGSKGAEAKKRIIDCAMAYGQEVQGWMERDFQSAIRLMVTAIGLGKTPVHQRLAQHMAELCRTRDDLLTVAPLSLWASRISSITKDNLSGDTLKVCANALCDAYLAQPRPADVIVVADVFTLAHLSGHWGNSRYGPHYGMITGQARKRLAEYLLERLDAGCAVSVGQAATQWGQLTDRLTGFMPPRLGEAWIAGVLRTIAPDQQSIRRLTHEEISRFMAMAERDGCKSIGDVLLNEWRRIRPPVPLHGTSSFAWANHLLQTASAVPHRQTEIWNAGLTPISAANRKFPAVLLGDLDRFLERLSVSETLNARKVLSDILRVGVDTHDTRVNVYGHLVDSILGQDATSTVAGLHELLQQADKEAKTNPTAAVHQYLRGMELAAGQKDVVSALTWRAVGLAVKQESMDAAVCENLLEAARDDEGNLPDALFDLACRGLFRRVLAANPQSRDSVWAEGLKPLGGKAGCMTRQTLAELDSLVDVLGESGPLSGLDAVTDLLLLAPDLRVLKQLQSRRIKLLQKRQAWEDALAAGLLKLVTEAVLHEDKLLSAATCADIMDTIGYEPQLQAAFWNRICLGADGQELDSQGAGTSIPAETIDSHLRTRARETLAVAVEENLSPRRHAVLALFAGHDRSSLTHLHASLSATPITNTSCLRDAICEISWALGVMDGSFGNCARFTRWLAATGDSMSRCTQGDADVELMSLMSSEKALATGITAGASRSDRNVWAMADPAFKRKVAERIIDAHDTAFLHWGGRALGAENRQWAIRFWVHATDTSSLDRIEETLTRIADIAAFVAETGASDVLVDLASSSNRESVQLRALRKAMAAAYYHKRYETYLELFDRLAPLPGTLSMTDGLRQARVLILLGKYPQALRQLNELRSWDGTANEHAQAMFLVAWIHLQNNEKDKAVVAIKQLVETYPDTTHADHANALREHLAGS